MRGKLTVGCSFTDHPPHPILQSSPELSANSILLSFTYVSPYQALSLLTSVLFIKHSLKAFSVAVTLLGSRDTEIDTGYT